MSKQMKTPTSHISEACRAPSLQPVLCWLALAQPCLTLRQTEFRRRPTNIRRKPDGFKFSLLGVRFLLLLGASLKNPMKSLHVGRPRIRHHSTRAFLECFGQSNPDGFQRSAAANPHSSENLPPSVAKQGVNQADAVVVCQIDHIQ